MADPLRLRQKILLRSSTVLDRFNEAANVGDVLIAPCDILISRSPLRSRQPDLLLISHEQLAKCKGDTDPEPLLAAPELVVEILSPAEGRTARLRKLSDYQLIGVRECWFISPQAQMIEVFRLTREAAETVAIYGCNDTVTSITFAELVAPVAEFFPPSSREQPTL